MKHERWEMTGNASAFHHPFEMEERLGNLSLTICYNDIAAEIAQREWNTDWHFHARCEIIALLSGNEQILADRKYHLPPGSICIIPQQLQHKTSPLDSEQKKISLLVAISLKSAHAHYTAFEERFFHLFNQLTNCNASPLFLTNQPDIMQNAQRAIEAKLAGNLISEYVFRYHITLFVLQACYAVWQEQNNAAPGGNGQPDAPSLSPDTTGIRNRMIEDFLYRNAYHSFTIRELADYLHLSERQTSRILLRQFGFTFKQIVNNNRIQTAKMMLLRGESINRTAELVGYQSINGFRKAFKAVEGVTPNEFVKRNRTAPD